MGEDKVELVLQNPDTEETLSVFIHPSSIPLAKRWLDELESLLSRGHFLEKNFSFLGFPNPHRTPQFLLTTLNQNLQQIGDYRAPGIWENGFSVDFVDDSMKVLSPDFFAKYRGYFAELMGQAWSHSPFYDEAPPEIRGAIRQINFLLHELESQQRSFELFSRRGTFQPVTIFSVLDDERENQPLLDEDYKDFSFNVHFGSVMMHYCQTGMTHYEAWKAGAKNLFSEEVSGLRFYSGEFVILWSDADGISPARKEMLEKFYSDLAILGVDARDRPYFVDPNGEKQGLGYLEVGRVDLTPFAGMSRLQIQNLIGRFSDIQSVKVHRGEREVVMDYPYLANDPLFRSFAEARL